MAKPWINLSAYPELRTCAEALMITNNDLKGPILVRVGQTHRKQAKRIFASEGSEGASGRWPALSEAYDARKRAMFGGQKILVATGEMKRQFVKKSSPGYIQRFQPKGKGGVFVLGAQSEIAVFHFKGADSTRTSEARRTRKKGEKPFKPKVFRVTLPKRDMATKTRKQLKAIEETIVKWYRDERIPQVVKACEERIERSNSAA